MKIGFLAVPAVLCGIGVMGAIADTWLVRAAARGNGMTSDPGYYDRALAWNDHQEAASAAARLGVVFEATARRLPDDGALLCVGLRDSQGRALSAETVTYSASANLCPRARVEVVLERRGDVYCTSIAAACGGVWVADVRAELEGQAVAGTTRFELGAAP